MSQYVKYAGSVRFVRGVQRKSLKSNSLGYRGDPSESSGGRLTGTAPTGSASSSGLTARLLPSGDAPGRTRPDSLRRPRVRDGEAALASALPRRDLRRPVLRARDDLVAPPRGGDHPHRQRGGDLRPRGPGGRRASAPATPTPTICRGTPCARAAETAAHIASGPRTVPPQPVSATSRWSDATGSRAWVACPSPSASPSWSGPTARPGPTTRASRRSSPPWRSRRGGCASRTPRACWPRTCSRCSRCA